VQVAIAGDRLLRKRVILERMKGSINADIPFSRFFEDVCRLFLCVLRCSNAVELRLGVGVFGLREYCAFHLPSFGRVNGKRGLYRRGCFDSGDLFLFLFLFDQAKLLVHLQAELGGGAAKLTHQLAELAGELGQTLGTEEQEGDEDEEGAVLRKLGIPVPHDTALG
jgi:hypothetical protein